MSNELYSLLMVLLIASFYSGILYFVCKKCNEDIRDEDNMIGQNIKDVCVNIQNTIIQSQNINQDIKLNDVAIIADVENKDKQDIEKSGSVNFENIKDQLAERKLTISPYNFINVENLKSPKYQNNIIKNSSENSLNLSKNNRQTHDLNK